MCNALINGISTGTMIMMIELLSSRHPIISSTTLIKISSSVLLSVIDNSQPATILGSPEVWTTQVMADALQMIYEIYIGL